jgi:RNA polymerase sigma-70 factor (ECF subfamily)
LRPPATDEALLAALRAGDAGAFDTLAERYAGRIEGLARSVLKNEQDAQDVVQDTFLSLHRHLDGYRGDAPFWPWLRRIAANHALMRLRRRRRKPETSLEIERPTFDADGAHTREIRDVAPLAEQVHQDAELGARIRAAVEGLPEAYRLVLVLADYEDRSMQEIAAALDLTIPNVKTRLHRARLAVREALERYLAGDE